MLALCERRTPTSPSPASRQIACLLVFTAILFAVQQQWWWWLDGPHVVVKSIADEGDDSSNHSSVIRSYLSDKPKGHFVILVWNRHGDLDLPLMKKALEENDLKHWFGDIGSLIDLYHSKPSKYGRVAMLYNSDLSGMVNWTSPVPIPVLAYTVPTLIPVTSNVYLYPSPYERGDYNRNCVWEARKDELSYDEKINKIVWRGVIHSEEMEVSRVIALELAQKHDWLDASSEDSLRLDISEMAKFKYQLDMGGLSGSTWGASRWKLCSGSVLFKVDSWGQDWWHPMLEPWKHFIPVNFNLTDLEERYQWAESHPDEAKNIAKTGEALCLETMTKEYIENYIRTTINSIPPATASQRRDVERFLTSASDY